MMSQRFYYLLTVSLLFTSNHLLADDVVESLVNKLEAASSTDERVDAARALQAVEDRTVLGAVNVLVKNCQHKDASVRNAAVIALGTILNRLDQPCHVALVQAALDSDAAVRTNATAFVGLLATQLPPECVRVLLDHAGHRDPETRSMVILALGDGARGNAWALSLIRQAAHDRDVIVRSNALVSWFKLTGDLEAILPYWLRLLDEPPVIDKSDPRSAAHEIVKIAVASRISELVEERPRAIFPCLQKMLGDDSAIIRGAAVRLLGAAADQSEECKNLARIHQVWRHVEPLMKDDEETVRSNAALSYRKLKKLQN